MNKWTTKELFSLFGFVLSLLWLVILALELVGEKTPFVFTLGTCVWAALVLQFLYQLVTSNQKINFIFQNPLFSLAIMIPAIRFLGLDNQLPWLKYLTATSAAQLVWIFGSLSVGLKSLRVRLRQQATILVTLMSLIVLFVGAAALYHYESAGLHSYAEAVWWTAMQMTTISSSFTPVTAAGQVIALAISVFSCGVFGLITAGLATLLIGDNVSNASNGIANQKSVNDLKEEIHKLHSELQKIRDHFEKHP